MRRTAAIAVTILALIPVAMAADKAKPISPYMRDTGILYLESVDRLSLKCGQTDIADSRCLGAWRSLLDGLEDRITVTLSETTKRPSGDKPYLELLKTVRYVRETYTTRDTEASRAVWGRVYVTCSAYAHTVALNGEMFNGDGGCVTAVKAATEGQ